MSAAITASTWAPADWIALAGVVATALGALATLGGVRLGMRLTARDTRKRDAETALIAVDLARRALDVEDLSTEDLADESLDKNDSEARLQRIYKADEVKLAHGAITVLTARRNENRVRTAAHEVDARLTSAQQLVAEWYTQLLAARKVTGTARDTALDKASKSLTSARNMLGELCSKADELREILKQSDLTARSGRIALGRGRPARLRCVRAADWSTWPLLLAA